MQVQENTRRSMIRSMSRRMTKSRKVNVDPGQLPDVRGKHSVMWSEEQEAAEGGGGRPAVRTQVARTRISMCNFYIYFFLYKKN